MKILTNKQLKEQQAAQAQQAAAVEGVLNEVAQLRAQLTPAGLLGTLAEYDPRALALLLDQLGSEVLIGGETWAASLRKRAVEMSRFAIEAGGTDVQLARAVATWTSWGFGREVTIEAVVAAANTVWQECWKAARNRPIFGTRSIHTLSEHLLTDGELFFIGYTARVDGDVTWRTLDTTRVTEILHPPDDADINVWYVVTMNDQRVAIPDAFAYFSLRDRLENTPLPDGVVDVNATSQALEGGGTFTVMLAAQRNRDRSGRGWPEFYRALPWSRVYAGMLEDYAAVFKTIAMVVEKIKVQGGQNTVDDIVGALQSSLVNASSEYRLDRNPPPVAGGTQVENEAFTRERMPLGSAAGDAQAGTMVIATQLSTALGITLPDAGRPDAMQNQAVAKEAARSPQQGWQRYQLFWTSVWSDLVETTLRLKAEFSRLVFTDYAAEISMTLPLDIETGDIVQAMDAITRAASAGTLDLVIALQANRAATELLLLDLGVTNVQDILTPPAAPPPEATVEGAPLVESHVAVTVAHLCPLCGAMEAHSYADHGPLLVCAGCKMTYNPEVE